MAVEDFRALGARLRNWGRWGDDDERGTVNLVTPGAARGGRRPRAPGQGVRPRHPVRRERPAAGRRADQPRAPHVADGRHPGVPRRLQVRRRLHLHAPPGRHPVGLAGPRLLRRPALQRVPGQRRHGRRGLSRHHRQDRQGRGRAGRAARRRPPQGCRLAGGRLRHHPRRPRGGHGRAGRRGGRGGRHPGVPHRLAPLLPRAGLAHGVHGWRARPRPGLLRVAPRPRRGRGVLRQLGHRGAARARTQTPSSRSTWCSSATWA